MGVVIHGNRLISGLAADTKPVAQEGSLFIEIDTPMVYVRKSGAWVSAAAFTRVGGDTTERTTTSVTSVDLSTISGLSIVQGRPFTLLGVMRKTTGAAAAASIGLKLNATAVRALFNWSGGANAADQGYFKVEGIIPNTGYDFSGYFLYTNGSAPASSLTHLASAGWPLATITDVIVTASVDSASITMGIDDIHLYIGAVA